MGTPRDGHRAYRGEQAALKRRTATEGLPCWWCGNAIGRAREQRAPHRPAATV